jgi:hypothetical protein
MRFINFINIMSLTETKNILYLVIFILLLVLFLKMYNESVENFWVYGTSTRLCNNRGCEVPRTAQSITYTPTSENDIVAHNSN